MNRLKGLTIGVLAAVLSIAGVSALTSSSNGAGRPDRSIAPATAVSPNDEALRDRLFNQMMQDQYNQFQQNINAMNGEGPGAW